VRDINMPTFAPDSDLSLAHHPLSKLFVQPRTPAEWEPYKLSAAQIVEFKEQGYLTGIRVLTLPGAVSSRGPGGLTRPLGTPSRSPWILYR
jgi:hypothetical protein